MDHISLLLSKVLRKHGIKDEADASLIVHVASQWLEEHGAAARATKFSEGKLFLEVQTSVAAQECHGRCDELLQFLRKRFPEIPLEQVRILRAMSTPSVG